MLFAQKYLYPRTNALIHLKSILMNITVLIGLMFCKL